MKNALILKANYFENSYFEKYRKWKISVVASLARPGTVFLYEWHVGRRF
jgi:hypothetical protein